MVARVLLTKISKKRNISRRNPLPSQRGASWQRSLSFRIYQSAPSKPDGKSTENCRLKWKNKKNRAPIKRMTRTTKNLLKNRGLVLVLVRRLRKSLRRMRSLTLMTIDPPFSGQKSQKIWQNFEK